MSGINCIRLTFVYLYFSPNTFPKIQQNLGDQLEIRLSVYLSVKHLGALMKRYQFFVCAHTV